MRPLASLTLECTQGCMFLLNAQFQRERRVQPCSDLLGIWRRGADPAARIGAPGKIALKSLNSEPLVAFGCATSGKY